MTDSNSQRVKYCVVLLRLGHTQGVPLVSVPMTHWQEQYLMPKACILAMSWSVCAVNMSLSLQKNENGRNDEASEAHVRPVFLP